MKEIGGYLELDRFSNQEYYSDFVTLNTARNALVYLSKVRKFDKVYIPYFLCESVSQVCEREQIKYDYYHINPDFTPSFDRKLGEGEYLYIVNYYGQFTETKVKELKQKYTNIIMDNVQAFFEKPVQAVDTIYSCRKFFGVPDGAYLSTDAPRIELQQDVSMERMRHILGRYESEFASEYYQSFKDNDDFFVELPLMSMSKLTHNLLRGVDYDYIKSKRDENWKLLHDRLCEKNDLTLVIPNAPYMYPFYCENGMNIRKALVEKKIYVPTLWPNVLHFEKCELEKEYAQNILPLPVDQRYDVEDMKRLIEEVLRCLN